MFIKVTDAVTGMPVLVNTDNVSKFEHSDNPDAVSVAFFVCGDCAHIKESLPEIERRLFIVGEFETVPQPFDWKKAHARLDEAIAAKQQAEAEVKRQLEALGVAWQGQNPATWPVSEWSKSRAQRMHRPP